MNKIYAFNRVIEKNGFDNTVYYLIIKAQAHLFKKYLVAMLKNPKQVKHVKKWAKKFYKEMYKKVDKKYIETGEATIIAQTGLDKPEHYEEYKKWLTLLQGNRKRVS